jgi:hypothetical protein
LHSPNQPPVSVSADLIRQDASESRAGYLVA